MCDYSYIERSKTRDTITDYLISLYTPRYGKPKSTAMVVSMVNLLEAKLLKPRSGYLIDLMVDNSTGGIYLRVDGIHSHASIEAKVQLRHLIYKRLVPWLKPKLRPL